MKKLFNWFVKPKPQHSYISVCLPIFFTCTFKRIKIQKTSKQEYGYLFFEINFEQHVIKVNDFRLILLLKELKKGDKFDLTTDVYLNDTICDYNDIRIKTGSNIKEDDLVNYIKNKN